MESHVVYGKVRKKMVRSISKVAACMLGIAMLVPALSGCGKTEAENNKPEYADSQAMSIIAKGYEKRSDKIEAFDEAGKDTEDSKNLKQIIQVEIDNDKPLKTMKYKDGKLQENVVAYINTLDDQIDVVDKFPSSSTDFYDHWRSVYDKRTSLLKLFYDKYHLRVGAKYQDDFNELLKNGANVTEKNAEKQAISDLVEHAQFNKQDDGYGYYTYSAVIQNTTKYSFNDVSILLSLYDSENVKVEEIYADADSWAAGESVKFEASSDNDASRVVASVSNYEVKSEE